MTPDEIEKDRALERIWAEAPEVFDGMGFWQSNQSAGLEAYVRADLFDAVTQERDDAKGLVIEANNSLYGSQGYFHSLDGGPYDRHHLARGIERIKEYGREQYQRADDALALVAAAYEAAAQTAFDHTPTKHGGAPLVAHVTGATIEREIRALTPADARDALDRRDRQMRAEGMREAVKIAQDSAQNIVAGNLPARCRQAAFVELSIAVSDLADKTEKGEV